jgi:hypothetical protein
MAKTQRQAALSCVYNTEAQTVTAEIHLNKSVKGHWFLEHHNRLLKYGFQKNGSQGQSFQDETHSAQLAPKKGPLLNPSASDLLQSQQMPS